MNTHKRQLLALLALAALAGRAPAQEAFPSRPLRFIVPFTPGGIADTMARVLGKAISDALGQPVVVENKQVPATAP